MLFFHFCNNFTSKMHMIWCWPPTNRTENAETGRESLLPQRSTSGLILGSVIKLLLDIVMAKKLFLTLDFNWHYVLYDLYLKHDECYISCCCNKSNRLIPTSSQSNTSFQAQIETEQPNPSSQRCSTHSVELCSVPPIRQKVHLKNTFETFFTGPQIYTAFVKK